MIVVRRFHLRLFAIMALLAFSFQLGAMEVGRHHAIKRAIDHTQAFEICTPYGIIWITPDGVEFPDPSDPASDTATNAKLNCPFCASAAMTLPLAATALSFLGSSPEVAAFPFIVLAVGESRAPDRRHAPLRAPPAFFA